MTGNEEADRGYKSGPWLVSRITTRTHCTLTALLSLESLFGLRGSWGLKSADCYLLEVQCVLLGWGEGINLYSHSHRKIHLHVTGTTQTHTVNTHTILYYIYLFILIEILTAPSQVHLPDLKDPL